MHIKNIFCSISLLLFLINGHSAAADKEYLKCNGVCSDKDTASFAAKYIKNQVGGVSNLVLSHPLKKKRKSDDILYIGYYAVDSHGALCGSGGCTFIILECDAKGCQVVGDIGLANLPVGFLSSSSFDRPDVAIWVQGGGEIPRRVIIKSEEKGYPSNPTTSPRASGSKNVLSNEVATLFEDQTK